MAILKWQVISSSNFASFFIVIIHNFSVKFNLIHFLLWIKRSHQSPNFEIFYVLSWKFTIFLILFSKPQFSFSSNFASVYSVMRNKSSILFQLKFICFQQKESIKVQIWSNLTWAVESLKFCTVTGSFCPNHTKFQPKKEQKSYLMTLKNDAKSKTKVRGFKYEFSPNHSKVWKCLFDGLFLFKGYRCYLS